MDPDVLTSAMERLSLLLGRLRKSADCEAKQVAFALKYLSKDLQPLDVISKLIQEFLAPQHPHVYLLAKLLFQVRTFLYGYEF